MQSGTLRFLGLVGALIFLLLNAKVHEEPPSRLKAVWIF